MAIKCQICGSLVDDSYYQEHLRQICRAGDQSKQAKSKSKTPQSKAIRKKTKNQKLKAEIKEKLHRALNGDQESIEQLKSMMATKRAAIRIRFAIHGEMKINPSAALDELLLKIDSKANRVKNEKGKSPRKVLSEPSGDVPDWDHEQAKKQAVLQRKRLPGSYGSNSK